MNYHSLYYILIWLNAKKNEIDHYSDKKTWFPYKGKSGKIEMGSSELITKRDLSLAYSPGVAAPVKYQKIQNLHMIILVKEI